MAAPPRYWRSLDELSGSGDFQRYLEAEFPELANAAGIDRRSLLKLMGASLALAGLAACGDSAPIGAVPSGKRRQARDEALQFATAVTLDGYATGVVVDSLGGRPIKVEGNPLHPASLGATDIFAQAEILALYDPDRSRMVVERGQPRRWEDFLAALDAVRAGPGTGIRILTETITSPTLAAQINRVLEAFPGARWHKHSPVGQENAHAGAIAAFGEAVDCRYHLDQASLILSLDADFLAPGPGHLRYAADFAATRRVDLLGVVPSRLIAVHSTPSLTSARADHRILLPPSAVETFARAVAAGSAEGEAGAIIAALREAGPQAVAIAGRHQPPAVHALAHAINQRQGAVGTTITYSDPVAVPAEPLADLVADMAAGTVDVLLILGGNPAYTAPADLAFAEHLERVDFSVHLGLEDDETAAACRWHVPQTHLFEAWGDARAYDGAVTIQQPLLRPLRDGRSALELLSALVGEPMSDEEILRMAWRREHGGDDSFEAFWTESLRNGVVADTAFPSRPMRMASGRTLSSPPPAADEALEILFQPDPTIWDGRYANNAWLQELPKPLSLLTWDNAALIAPVTAARHGLENGDVVEITSAAGRLQAPVWIMPGQAPDCVTLPLGYGRRRAGRLGTGAGFDAYRLRTAAAPWLAGGELRPTGARHALASTQHHHSMDGRDLVRAAPLAEFRDNPRFAQRLTEPPPSIYPDYDYSRGHAWGMAIDLNSCIGCNACVVACQAENNTPVVGKEEVGRGREMHWLRIDRYYEGDPESPGTHFQPMLCMHCEKAPCELVCPVNATVHSSEGLNEMVYNRCIGTRACSNNCPYKVRRFNWFDYQSGRHARPAEANNPDVTVRNRGTMEKCTYCVQRISAGRIAAKMEQRPLRDGEVVTACQQVCPTRAIVFGDLNDPDSAVNRRKASPLNYSLLGEINTRPRTTYLARVDNPLPRRDEDQG